MSNIFIFREALSTRSSRKRLLPFFGIGSLPAPEKTSPEKRSHTSDPHHQVPGIYDVTAGTVSAH